MKQHKSQVEMLNSAITRLKFRKIEEYEALKEQFHQTGQAFKPINILNETVKEFREAPNVKRNIFEAIFSIAGGYFSKKIVLGKTNSFGKNILGYLLQFAVTNFISKKVKSEHSQ